MTGVTGESPQAAYLIRAEAVAKISSFRQLRVSTINVMSSVTPITFASDGGQQGRQSETAGMRVVICIRGMMRITSVHAGLASY